MKAAAPLAAAAMLLAAAAGAACSGREPAPGPRVDPAVARVCADARAAVVNSTAALVAERDKAASATDRGDNAARDAAIAAARAIFGDWAAQLRAQAALAPDPKLKTTLTEYGGAVDAVAARLATDGDLEILETFDGSELDVAASRLSEVCP